MLTIENLHAQIEGKDILKGIDLDVKAGEVHAIMGPNGSGKSTLSSVIAGNEDYEMTQGKILLKGKDLAELDAEERAHEGIFLSFQYPVEIPGVSVTNFIKTAINANRKAQGLEDMPASELLKKIREKAQLLEIDSKFLSRSLNEGQELNTTRTVSQVHCTPNHQRQKLTAIYRMPRQKHTANYSALHCATEILARPITVDKPQ